jgi:hypothetical protein
MFSELTGRKLRSFDNVVTPSKPRPRPTKTQPKVFNGLRVKEEGKQ